MGIPWSSCPTPAECACSSTPLTARSRMISVRCSATTASCGRNRLSERFRSFLRHNPTGGVFLVTGRLDRVLSEVVGEPAGADDPLLVPRRRRYSDSGECLRPPHSLYRWREEPRLNRSSGSICSAGRRLSRGPRHHTERGDAYGQRGEAAMRIGH